MASTAGVDRDCGGTHRGTTCPRPPSQFALVHNVNHSLHSRHTCGKDLDNSRLHMSPSPGVLVPLAL